ncbi:uncharacterized protein LOC34619569 [Cyclospora cayetanensis]|uniref:Uncharacterized protein LOC34619569 n=1 Tax=Cyclospora cayetanensis TaxID=88456 RepID=A0A6P6S0G5_9EIME|nr:uncharacterized protein LOC34619569 [Cyclospora cayetanensis]
MAVSAWKLWEGCQLLDNIAEGGFCHLYRDVTRAFTPSRVLMLFVPRARKTLFARTELFPGFGNAVLNLRVPFLRVGDLKSKKDKDGDPTRCIRENDCSPATTPESFRSLWRSLRRLLRPLVVVSAVLLSAAVPPAACLEPSSFSAAEGGIAQFPLGLNAFQRALKSSSDSDVAEPVASVSEAPAKVEGGKALTKQIWRAAKPPVVVDCTADDLEEIRQLLLHTPEYPVKYQSYTMRSFSMSPHFFDMCVVAKYLGSTSSDEADTEADEEEDTPRPGGIIGVVAAAEMSAKSANILMVAVHENFRRMGLGEPSQITDHDSGTSSSPGRGPLLSDTMLHVWISQLAPLHLYMSMGFGPTRYIPAYYNTQAVSAGYEMRMPLPYQTPEEAYAKTIERKGQRTPEGDIKNSERTRSKPVQKPLRSLPRYSRCKTSALWCLFALIFASGSELKSLQMSLVEAGSTRNIHGSAGKRRRWFFLYVLAAGVVVSAGGRAEGGQGARLACACAAAEVLCAASQVVDREATPSAREAALHWVHLPAQEWLEKSHNRRETERGGES